MECTIMANIYYSLPMVGPILHFTIYVYKIIKRRNQEGERNFLNVKNVHFELKGFLCILFLIIAFLNHYCSFSLNNLFISFFYFVSVVH